MGSVRRWWLPTVGALLLTACTVGVDVADPVEQRTGVVATTGADVDGPTAGTAAQVTPAPTERATASASPAPPQPDDELGGADVTWFDPDTGLTIFGITTTLHARAMPGLSSPAVDDLYPIDRGPVATGRARRIADTVWVEVELSRAPTTGWVDRRLVGVAGPTEDIGAEVPAGAAVVGADVLDLGVQVMTVLGHEPEGLATVLSQAPLIVDREATVAWDVKSADALMLGERIRVVGAPTDSPDGRFELRRVERTVVCARTVADDGTCA